MDESMRNVLRMFAEMNSEKLDLHTLFEAAGNEPAARNEVVEVVGRLVRQGYLESQGSDFYTLTDKGKKQITDQ